MNIQSLATPPGLRPSGPEACPGAAETALMHGLAKGLEGLLGAKPVPRAPKIACCCGATPDGRVTRLQPRTARTAPAPAERPAGQVIQLPLRACAPIFAASVNRLTESRLVRL
jgi:hypothetical protein